MNKKIITLLLMSAFAAPVVADKPEWAGKGKPSDAQKAAHTAAMEAKEGLDEQTTRIKGKAEKKKKDTFNELKGLEKQAAKKSQQSQKELDKGSEKGKASREQHSKKWWQFWGE